MEDIFEQIRNRHDKQEQAFKNCIAERDKLAEENANLRAKLVKREDELCEVKYELEDAKEELEAKEEMIKRVEHDYSQTLAMLVDVQEERDKSREELEKEKRSQIGLQDKLEKYGDVLEKVDNLYKSRSVKQEEAKEENKVGGMEGGLEQSSDGFRLVNLGSVGEAVRIRERVKPVANLKDALVVDLTQESDGDGEEGVVDLNQVNYLFLKCFSLKM